MTEAQWTFYNMPRFNRPPRSAGGGARFAAPSARSTATSGGSSGRRFNNRPNYAKGRRGWQTPHTEIVSGGKENKNDERNPRPVHDIPERQENGQGTRKTSAPAAYSRHRKRSDERQLYEYDTIPKRQGNVQNKTADFSEQYSQHRRRTRNVERQVYEYDEPPEQQAIMLSPAHSPQLTHEAIMELNSISALSLAPSDGSFTVHDIILWQRDGTVPPGLDPFYRKIEQVLGSWTKDCARVYRAVTGKRLLPESQGRSHIGEHGDRLESFDSMCDEMIKKPRIIETRRKHDRLKNQIGHMFLAVQDSKIVGILEMDIDFGGQCTTGPGSRMSEACTNIHHAISRRVVDSSLPSGIMSTLVALAAEATLRQGIQNVNIDFMHKTAVTYWKSSGFQVESINGLGWCSVSKPGDVLRALARRRRPVNLQTFHFPESIDALH